jgi:hypothetical protein
MRCPNCDEPVDVDPGVEVRFVAREAAYLILAKGRVETRLVHECSLRGAST